MRGIASDKGLKYLEKKTKKNVVDQHHQGNLFSPSRSALLLACSHKGR
ncbi:MAG: hypothetical protein IPP33_03705 [Flavobacteriales bacterium]|nr:hypothetical protein [Flavobacteriales bacterium]